MVGFFISFDYSLYNCCGAMMTIKGSLYWSIPMLKRFSVAKTQSSQNWSPKWQFFKSLNIKYSHRDPQKALKHRVFGA